MQFQYNDGGRKEAGYEGHAGDCVTRAIAIATQKPYQEVYTALNELGKAEHIGIAIHDFDPVHQTIQTIEGNTSDGNNTNGDGVYKRTRSASLVRAAIRPAYKE